MSIGTHFKGFVKQTIEKAIKRFPDSLRNQLMRALLEELYFSRKAPLRKILCTEWPLRVLKENGFSPAMIIDCGAYIGNWTREIKSIFPDARVLMLEADPEKETDLKKVQNEYPHTVDYAISLLGAEERVDVTFHKMRAGSSVLEEQSNAPRNIVRLSMTTLDKVACEKGFSDTTFIKLDVQGYELEVLKGATNLLDKAHIVLLEVSFLQYNKGAPLIDEVMAFMKYHGFVVYDIGELVRWGTNNMLLQGDLIFIKHDSALRPGFFRF